MVSVENFYGQTPAHVFDYLRVRRDYFYLLRLYKERAPFVSAPYMEISMRTVLRFFESVSAVLHAVVKNDGEIFYMEILCASPMPAPFFSAAVRRAVPSAVMEVLEADCARNLLDARGSGAELPVIPNAEQLRSVRSPKTALLGLLLEYRAFAVSVRDAADSLRPAPEDRERRADCGRSSSAPFLFFERQGRLCGVPAFQVTGMRLPPQPAFSDGERAESSVLCFEGRNGTKELACAGVLFVEEMDVASCLVSKKIAGGMFLARADALRQDNSRQQVDFALVIPNFLP